jgi:hypothetical protein
MPAPRDGVVLARKALKPALTRHLRPQTGIYGGACLWRYSRLPRIEGVPKALAQHSRGQLDGHTRTRSGRIAARGSRSQD